MILWLFLIGNEKEKLDPETFLKDEYFDIMENAKDSDINVSYFFKKEEVVQFLKSMFKIKPKLLMSTSNKFRIIIQVGQNKDKQMAVDEIGIFLSNFLPITKNSRHGIPAKVLGKNWQQGICDVVQ